MEEKNKHPLECSEILNSSNWEQKILYRAHLFHSLPKTILTVILMTVSVCVCECVYDYVVKWEVLKHIFIIEWLNPAN